MLSSRDIVSSFPDVPQMMFPASQDEDHHNNNNMVFPHHSIEPPSSSSSSSSSSSPSSLLFNLSILKDKLTQMQTLAGALISHGPAAGPGHPALPDPTSSALASMNSIIQEFIVTASSMMLTCQHMLLNCPDHQNLDWFGSEDNILQYTNSNNISLKEENQSAETIIGDEDNDIIEVNAADLLAKYTHYCQICGKGFKRDANLRMHMRAHGDEYKTSAALSNPVKKRLNYSGKKDDDDGGDDDDDEGMKMVVMRAKKYSCPQEGCRWNKKHERFQPLKSMICVKNHYKRSHCPKMYVCKRCNLKQFSVLSDLRTHEKHCGDVKWQCSCGTTFSRKDKLMGHLALFLGHAPLMSLTTTTPTPAALSSCLENC
ncbi:protein SENSITIVE TO PROTON RHIZOTOXICITY 2-like [Senna tora]|uniref:Protein SENSITIVE TO PROTON RHIZOTOXICITY 2-like n=1 Tax=Senna tora TaxID=362788 RepID=A0A834TLX9_9FABA|nr:protein SENSITIVE TO PROTON RHIZOTOXICITY 2-like [Senna tora]